jgi:hypothetical protein
MMSITKNLAPGVKSVLLKNIFAVVRPDVRVDLSPGYSILSPPTLRRVRSVSFSCALMSTTKEQ